jgi:hypothetical protein
MTDAATPRPDAAELTALEDWVDWLKGHYPLTYLQVTECWALHNEQVEELTALHRSWLAAYTHGAHPDAALRWHEAFAEARHRQQDWILRAGCRVGEHHELR